MFSLFNGRKEYYYASRDKNEELQATTTATPNRKAGIQDSGIVVENQEVPPSPFGINSYAVDEDLAPSELSSSAYGDSHHSSYHNQQDTDSPSQEITPKSRHSQSKQHQQSSNSNKMRASSKQQQQQQQQQQQSLQPKQQQLRRSPNPSSVHAISYVTQAPEHGYSAGYEDDLSTLGDESIIRRGKHNQQKQMQLAQKQLEHQQKLKEQYAKSINKAHTKSTEEMSPRSHDLSFTFSNVLDVNERIHTTSRLGYEITDDSMTDRGGKEEFENDGKSDKQEEEGFIERNKWMIIKFIVIVSLFLLMVAAGVLVVSLLHMRSIANQTEAWTMGNGNLAAATTDDDDAATSDFGTYVPFVPKIPAWPSPFPATESPSASPMDAPSASPMEAPSAGPTISPSTLPPTVLVAGDVANSSSASEQAKIGTDLKFVIANFSPSSLPLLDDPTSAQSRAFDWMTKDPSYWNMEISRIVQRWTLAVLFYSTGGPNWNVEYFPEAVADDKSPWLSYSDECLWESTNDDTLGLICDNDKNYFGIHLRNVGLTGSLPSELGLLSDHLRLLFVNGNDLTGSLPSELGRLSALEKLNLQYNNFSGSLPSEIGNWGQLTIASLGNNQFSGQIPASTGSWGSMHTIGFENNVFYGTLPPEWSNLPYLESVSLQGNFLTGTIPYDYNFLYQLTSLSLQRNDLTGEMQQGLCPGENSMQELSADCPREMKCNCCTQCFRDGK